MVQPNRLPAQGEHRLKGSEIDPERAIGFRLDGREIRGFAGDTLLSAVLASGIIGAGTHDGEPLALDERFAPPVLLRGHTHDRLRALSLERTPAIDGLDLVTLGNSRRGRYGRAASLARSLLPGRRASLDLNYDDYASLTGPWFDAPAEREIRADLAVVGGGLAGMGAALAAGKRGSRVVLIERRQWLGGEVRFFGTGGDAESPDEMIGRLAASIAELPNITVLFCAEAFAVFEGTVRVNQVTVENGVPASHALTVSTSRIVLANGTVERLPIFAGNRRPGVVGALAAFNRADRFGVWLGRQAVLATATSVGYRTATAAVDAGIAIPRIFDTRLNPQSRFIAFSKAYGIATAWGLRPRSAGPAGLRGGLVVDFEHAAEANTRPGERYTADQLLVSAGWQPDLTLWHMAGGGSRWEAASSQLAAEGALSGIVLAGSVAGYRKAAACIQSGQAAVASLFGRSVADVEDPIIDPLHETPDDATPIGTADPKAGGNSYLDGGASLAQRPMRAGPLGLRRSRRAPPWSLADQARPLGVADVAAGVELGIVPPEAAAIVAQERCVTPGDIVDAGRSFAPGPALSGSSNSPPEYLAGRFGPKPSTWLVEPGDGRSFEPGCLVYPDADSTDPLAAIGAVFAPAPEGRTGGLAVISRSYGAGTMLVVRDISAPISVQLVDPDKP